MENDNVRRIHNSRVVTLPGFLPQPRHRSVIHTRFVSISIIRVNAYFSDIWVRIVEPHRGFWRCIWMMKLLKNRVEKY